MTRHAHTLSYHKTTGQYCKKHQGKVHYFGTNPIEALRRFADEWPDIIAGKPRAVPHDSITVGELANLFLDHKRKRISDGELSPRTWSEYHRACELLVKSLGRKTLVEEVASSHFAALRDLLADTFGLATLAKHITLTKTVFKWGYESELLAEPVRYGNRFAKPPKHAIRIAKSIKPPKMLEAEQIRTLLEGSDTQLKAMILLGINCGFGAKDCADLQHSAIVAGWVNFPRPKTGIARRCPLWPETLTALRAVARKRPKPKDEADAGCVFITKYGHRWIRTVDKGPKKRPMFLDALAYEFRKLKKRLGVKAEGGPYVLRHVFRTVGDAVKDPVAIGIIMGHEDGSQAANYRQRVDDSRLQAVVDHVRAWLLGV